MKSFAEFALAPPILRALDKEGHTSPTPIQSQAIPPIMSGRDLMGIAQTGTGKTAAFALPVLHRLAVTPQGTAGAKRCRAVVLSPTRELAQQIGERFNAYGRYLSLRTVIALGGVPIRKQIRALAPGADVVIATPGRLIDLMENGAVDLGSTEMVVLDEADRMLDMGFVRPIRQILAKVPRQRQTMFFSATMPDAIAALSRSFLTNPAMVSVAPVAKTADRIDQHVLHVEPGRKMPELEHLLGGESVERALVFARTKRGADRIVRGLAKGGVNAQAIHGNKTQSQREKALNAFRNGKTKFLIATDIAARGIDVANVTHVINYDLPNEPESYVHRIGRAGRGGAGGTAIALCTSEDRAQLNAIEKLIKQRIPVMNPDAEIANRGDLKPAAAKATKSRRPNRPRRQNRRKYAAPAA